MFLVCPGCGEWSNQRPVVDSTIVCECGWKQPIALHPLLLVTGASGTGKTTIALQLAGRLPEAVVLDQDILWMPEMDTPEDNWKRFGTLWLRVAANIAQSGRPVMLLGSAVPGQYERLPERRLIGPIHTLALVCEEDELVRRLADRPSWRDSCEASFITAMLQFNQSLRRLALESPDSVTLLDTTCESAVTSVSRVSQWAIEILKAQPPI
jgi:energy-coupling factor transporter ATP-binding protein EcfA2